MLYGIFGAIRAECFLRVTGARRPFTAVTRVQIPSGTPKNQRLKGVRAILSTTFMRDKLFSRA